MEIFQCYLDCILENIEFIFWHIISYSMDCLLDIVERYPTFFEELAKSKNPQEYLSTLPYSFERDLLLFLLQPIDQDYEQNLKTRFNLKKNLIDKIVKWKMLQKLETSQSYQEIEHLAEKLKKEFGGSLNYAQPTNMNQNKAAKDKSSEHFPTALKKVETLKEWALSTLNKNQRSICEFSDAAIRQIPEQRLLELSLGNRSKLVASPLLLLYFSDNFVIEAIKREMLQRKQKNKNFELPQIFLKKMPDDLFMKLGQAIPAYFSNITYLTQFMHRLSDKHRLPEFEKEYLSIEEQKSKRQVLLEILAEMKKLQNPKLQYEYRMKCLEVLLLDIEIENFDKEYFIYYMEQAFNESTMISQKQARKMSQQMPKNPLRFVHKYVNSQIYHEGLKKYIEGIFRLKEPQKSLQELKKYFKAEELQSIYARAILETEGNEQKIGNLISTDEIRRIKSEKYLQISDRTKKRLKVKDEVELKISIKNISEICVKIYQIDLEKLCLQEKQFNHTQDLSYLKPTESFIYKVDNFSPFIKMNFEIILESIAKKRGVWIVELEAEGLSSRAIINKGAITYSERVTEKGLQLSFYNEEGHPIKEMHIWINERKHEVKRKHVIPFGESTKSMKLISVYEGLAEEIHVKVPQEFYHFDVGYIYSFQSFLANSIAKVVLNPRLKIAVAETEVSLKLLKKVRVKVEMLNNLNIKNSIDFDNISFQDNEDYPIEFPIQSFLKKITISVEGTISLLNRKEQTVFSKKQIQIELNEGSNNFVDMYFKQTKEDNYSIFVLGKNGEPQQNTELMIHLYPRGRKEEQHFLYTDQNGEIKLGNIVEHVDQIRAEVNTNIKNNKIQRFWDLKDFQKEIFLHVKYVYREGQIISIPYPFEKKDILLLKENETGQISERCSDKVIVENRWLKIEGLLEGKYILANIWNSKQIEIRVLKAAKWENNKQIFNERKNELVNVPEKKYLNISIGNIQAQEKEDKIRINVPVQSDGEKVTQNIRAHLIASNFHYPELANSFPIHEFRHLELPTSLTFSTKNCQFFNNKAIAEEAAYVLSRTKQHQHIGNNLDKPKILLKRKEVRDTNETQQMLDLERGYLQGSYQPIKNRSQHKYPRQSTTHKHHQLRAMPAIQINSHNNFLHSSAQIKTNSKGNQLIFEVPKTFSHFDLILIAPGTVLKKQFNLPRDEIKCKSLIHEGISETSPKKGMGMQRKIYKVYKGEQIKVNRGSTWCAVGIQNILNFAKIKNVKLEDWVARWDTYSLEEKKQVFDEKTCHELNCFIKFNDEPFFEEVVKPFISNKLHKTFVDLYLLDQEKCLKWSEFSRLQTLNWFERILLIKCLLNRNRRQIAIKIANSMDNCSKAETVSQVRFQNEFDTIITAEESKKKQKYFQPESQMDCAMEYFKCQKQDNEEDQLQIFCNQCDQQCFKDMSGGMAEQSEDQSSLEDLQKKRALYKQPFKEMQKTKQYTETTYSGLKNPNQSLSVVQQSPFWSSLAIALIEGRSDFLTQNFMYLKSTAEFTLAACFIPSHKILDYRLKIEGEQTIIQADNSFLVYVKEIKQLDFEKKFGVLINQRFFDPEDMYYYEDDGTKVEKQVKQFIIKKPYLLQSLVTNTSGTSLELQLLIDLPKGSIPLKSHEYTQILNLNLSPYTTKQIQRIFYFPTQGSYPLYPGNVSRKSIVIAKAQMHPPIIVKKHEEKKALNSFNDVLKEGNKDEILKFLETKNIFDHRIISFSSIYWMMKDREFYLKVISILRDRGCFNQFIWAFAFLHGDLPAIQEQIHINRFIINQFPLNISAYEYFPYYSSRTHKFQNESKSTIRNNQFKNSYYQFLFQYTLTPMPKSYIIVFIYYLLLQDRINEASEMIAQVDEETKLHSPIQFDYMQCFIDMYNGYPSFVRARKISAKYADYPVKTWRKMFKEIIDTLKEYDSEEIPVIKKAKVEYEASALNEGHQIRLVIPPETEMEVLIYQINLQLYFSNFPFETLENISTHVVPNQIHKFSADDEPKVNILKRPDTLKDAVVEVFTSTNKLKKCKLTQLSWNNPQVQIKTREEEGLIQVFLDGKKCPGCYCKVYQNKHGEHKFYRDGYTDITGTFKYALSDLEGISEFAVLVVSQKGGNVVTVNAPSLVGEF